MDTYGWDTVFVISMDKVNAALAANQDKILEQFDYKESSIEMSGTFDAWKVVKGGSGKLLRMEFPIKAGTLTMPGQPQAKLDNVTLVAEISLQLLPTEANKQNLTFDLKAVGKDGQTGPGLVTPTSLIDPCKHLNAAQYSLVYSLLPQYLVDNAAQISYIFAQINFAKPITNSWLTPVKCDYSYMQKEGGAENGYLAILSVTTNRDISTLSREVDPNIVTGSSTTGYLISEDLFLENVIMPILPTIYFSTSPSTFRFYGSDHTIRNTQDFSTSSVRSGAITYHPEIQHLTTTIRGGSLVTSISGDCSLHAGISMTYTLGMTNAASFDSATERLTFLKDNSPSSSHHAHIPWYWFFLGPLPDIITNTVVKIISSSIANTLQSDAKTTFTRTPPQSVHWTGTDVMYVTSAGLNGCFYMQGTI